MATQTLLEEMNAFMNTFKKLTATKNNPDELDTMKSSSGEAPVGILNNEKSLTIRDSRSLSSKCQQNRYKCTNCAKTFGRKNSLVTHQDIHKGKRYQCINCAKTFGRKSSLVIHQDIHEGNRRYKCAMCKKAFFRKDTLKRHQHTHAKDWKIEGQKNRPGQKIPTCSKFDETFYKKFNLNRHQKQINFCLNNQDKTSEFLRKEEEFDIKTHRESPSFRQENVPPMVNTSNKQNEYKCLICKKTFSKKGSLRRHQITQNGIKQYSCKKCSKSFFRKFNLERHERTHTKMESENHKYLDTYTQNETPEVNRSEVSTIVEKFSIKTYTDRPSSRPENGHPIINISKKQNEYRCSSCEKTFSKKGSLRRHQNIHNGIKPYSCKLCSTSFFRKFNLKRHEQTCTKTESCNQCNYKAPQPCSLTAHKKSLHKDVTNICD